MGPYVPEPGMRVLLADVPGAGRSAVAAVLRSLTGVLLVGEVGSVDELDGQLRRGSADVLVVDDRLLIGRGLGLRDAALAVIVMGLDDDPSYARRAQGLGATAWVAKERADELLPAALAQAREGLGSVPD
jgi:DNA-binding NarL/FixJ family response regulator